jgi:hypothetical protein
MARLLGSIITLALLLLITVDGSAGAKGGQRRWTRKMDKNGEVYYKIEYIGGQTAEFAIIGDGSTDVDIFVMDQNGKVVASDTGFSDLGLVTWKPAQTQVYTIKVQNLQAGENTVVMGHN